MKKPFPWLIPKKLIKMTARAKEWKPLWQIVGRLSGRPSVDIGRVQYLERVYETADALESWLGSNVGTSADWPIQITACEDSRTKIAALLNDLKDALMPLRLQRDGKTK